MPLRILAVLLSCVAGLAAYEHPFAKAVFTDGGESIPYRVKRPAAIEAGKTYPLLLWLHGAGDRGDNNENHIAWTLPDLCGLADRAKMPYFAIAPHCAGAYRWVEVDWSLAKPHATPAKPSVPMRLTIALLKKFIAENPVDPDRIYVAGMSMGGYGTWDLMVREPSLVAAAIPICGGADDSQAARIKHIPVWNFHGARDAVVPVGRSRSIIAALRAAGGTPKYTEYPDVEHGAWAPAVKEPGLIEWLFSQRRTAPR